MPQLFDGVSIVHTGLPNLALEVGHYHRMRDTSGSLKELRLTVAEAWWNSAPAHSVSAYAVFHDQPDHVAFTGLPDESYRVVGVRAEGAAASRGDIDVVYLMEYARQRPYAGGDARIDVDYWRLALGLSSPQWTVRHDRFRSDFGNVDLGREVDLGVTLEILPNLLARLQHARYDPGAGGTEVSIRKTWLTASCSW